MTVESRCPKSPPSSPSKMTKLGTGRRGNRRGGHCRAVSTSALAVWMTLIVTSLVILQYKAWNNVKSIEELASIATSPQYDKHHLALTSKRSLTSSNSNRNIGLKIQKKRLNSTTVVKEEKSKSKQPLLHESAVLSNPLDEENPKAVSTTTTTRIVSSSTKKPPHYRLGLVRAIGNALPPRHDANQTMRNLEFILKYEPPFSTTVHKHWIFNRIQDAKLLQQLIDLLHLYNQSSHTVIPFVLKDYAKTQYEFKKTIKREEYDMIHKIEFNGNEDEDSWGTMDRASYWDKILHWKNLYITNQNNARNLALDWYLEEHPEQENITGIVTPSMVDYVLPWDGNCFLTQAAHDQLQEDLIKWNGNPFADEQEDNTHSSSTDVITPTRIRNVTITPIKYFFTRMDRLKQENEALLDPNYQPVLKEEPQIIMHRTAIGRFDPSLRYGMKNKVAMLIRLRIAGSWDKFHNGQPPPEFEDWQGPTRSAGWVSRLFSGSAKMEEANKSQMRGKARSDGMMLLVQRVDLQVAQELYHWNESTWMYFDRNVVTQHATQWRQRQTRNDSAVNTDRKDDDLGFLVDVLLEYAHSALIAGPWSVMDKQPCGCGPSGDCHRYYNVKGNVKATNATLTGQPTECTSKALRFDRDRLEAFQFNTTILALAYTITGDQRYAVRAASNLAIWFVDPSTRMSPDQLNVVWSGKSKETLNSKLGIIDFKDLYFFLDAIRMIEESGALSQKNQRSIKAWFNDYLYWLAIRRDSSFRRKGQHVYFEPNHHGLYYDIQLAAVASYTGNLSLALETFQESASRMLTHVYANGKLMMEVGGKDCEHQQSFTLQGWASIARMAQKVGLNYWKRFPSRKDNKGVADSALCRAAEYTIPLLQNRARCTESATHDPDISRWFPLYLEAQKNCPNLAVKNGKYWWPDWWPALNSSEIPLPIDNPYKMKPLFTQATGIAPFWNLGWHKDDFEITGASNDVPSSDSPRSEWSNLPATKRDLSALPGYYKKYTNGTLNPPKVYLYDVLPAYEECLSDNQAALERYKTAYKHGGEVWFLEQVAASPWRTFDKEAADLFVIPLLPGFVLYQKVCVDEAVQTLRWIKNQRQEQHSTLRNHVLLTTHYVAENPTVHAWCPSCIHLHQENSADAPKRHGLDVLTLSAPMMSQLYRVVKDSPYQSTALSPAITEELRNQDINEFLSTRPRVFYFAGQADNRKAYQGRRQVQRVWEQLNRKHKKKGSAEDFTFIITKQNPKYTSENSTFARREYNFTRDVSTTRFGYQGRGDNPTSSRIYEWIDVGAIPVIVIDDAWLPGKHIPWRDFIISVPESLNDEELMQEFERIAYAIPKNDLDAKRQSLKENAPAILWAAKDSVVAEVLLADAWEAFQERRGSKASINEMSAQVAKVE